MTRPMDNFDKVKKNFKEYVRKFCGAKGVTAVTLEDAVKCLDLAVQKTKFGEDEYSLFTPSQAGESKIDISREHADKMIKCLSLLAQWTDENTEECDEPWAARQARRVLEEIGVTKKSLKPIKINVDSN